MDRPIYELIINKEKLQTMTELAFVNAPAIKVNFVAFGSQEVVEVDVINQVEFSILNKDKHMVIGPLMIPNELIERLDKVRGSFDTYYTSETIIEIKDKFTELGLLNKLNHEHQKPLLNNCIVESWIIEDTNIDKSSLYGFSLPVGTWMATIKINSEEYWNNYIKTGEVNGLSIQGYFDYIPKGNPQKVGIKKDNTIMSKQSKFAMLITEYTIGPDNTQVFIDDKYQLINTSTNERMPGGDYETNERWIICVDDTGTITSISNMDTMLQNVVDSITEDYKSVKPLNQKQKKMSKFKRMFSSLVDFFADQTVADQAVAPDLTVAEPQTTTEPQTLTQEITFPVEGGTINLTTSDGQQYQLVITKVDTATPLVDPASNPDQNVASPVMAVSAMSAIELENKQLKEKLERFSKAVKPVEFKKATEDYKDTPKVFSAKEMVADSRKYRKFKSEVKSTK
jgi:hypothetical protein